MCVGLRGASFITLRDVKSLHVIAPVHRDPRLIPAERTDGRGNRRRIVMRP